MNEGRKISLCSDLSFALSSNCSSLHCEVLVRDKEPLSLCFSDLEHTDDTTWAAITEGRKRDGMLNEVFSLLESEITSVIGIKVASDEGGAWPGHGPFTLLVEARLVHAVNLVAHVWVPAWADHASWEGTSIRVDDWAHDVGGRCHWRESTEFVCLRVHIVSDHLGDHLRVGWCSRSEATCSLVNKKKKVRVMILTFDSRFCDGWARVCQNIYHQRTYPVTRTKHG